MSWRSSLKGGNGTPPPGSPFTKKQNPLQQRRVKVHHTTGFRSVSVATETPAFQFRAVVTLFFLTLMFAAMGVRLAYVGLMPPAEPRVSIRDLPTEPGRRGNIYDRNGVLLAATLKVYSLYADPKRILDMNEAVRKLNAVLPELKKDWLLRVLGDPDRRFVWLKRRLTPAEAQKVIALGVPGFSFREEFVRVYPHQNLVSHVLGAVDVDNTGLAGVERAYDKDLRKGKDLDLAIDVRAQDLLRQSVKEALDTAGAKAAWGVVMDSKTGEILALTSQPDYDPNHFGKATDDQRFNRAVLASYEMGSTFKIFTLAQGLAEGKITPETVIDCREPIHIGRYTIKDYHAKKALLTATEILRYSSNIGAAKIADMSGPEAQKAFMGKLGMLEPLNIGLSEVGPVRYPSNWGRVQTFTIAFGHGMMVTPVHLVAAVGALATDGYYRPPHILKGGKLPNDLPRVMGPETIQQMRDLMRDVVVSGSGRSSQVPGYDIGGKTGTAEKASGGGYDHSKNVVSFVAALPLNDPEYIVLVMLDEPKKGYETGGRSASPAVGKFIQRFALMTGLPPDMSQIETLRAKERKLKPMKAALAMPTAADADLSEAAGAAGGTAGDVSATVGVTVGGEADAVEIHD